MVNNKTESIHPPDANKTYLSTSEVATYLGLSIQTVYKLTSKREFPIYKPGNKKIFVKREDLDEWINAGTRPSRRIIQKDVDNRLLNKILK